MNEQKFPNELMEQFAAMMKAAMPAMPVVKQNKNGYEIRTKILEIAQNQTWQDFQAKWGKFETGVKKEGDELVTSVTVPSVDAVLATAKKFYEFVSEGITKQK